MSDEFFRNLAAYKAAMSLAKGMLRQGIISEVIFWNALFRKWG